MFGLFRAWGCWNGGYDNRRLLRVIMPLVNEREGWCLHAQWLLYVIHEKLEFWRE